MVERDTKRFLTASFRPRIKARPSGRSGDGQCATVFRKKLTRCDILVAGHTCSRKAGPSPIDRARLMLHTYDNSQNHHFVISHKHAFDIWIIFPMEAFFDIWTIFFFWNIWNILYHIQKLLLAFLFYASSHSVVLVSGANDRIYCQKVARNKT